MTKRTKKGRKTSQRALRARQRQAQALQLRVEGHRLDDIARQLGYRNRSSVAAAIDSELARNTSDNVQKLREIEELRLNLVLARHLPIAVRDPMPGLDQGGDSAKGEAIAKQISRSAGIVDRISKRRAKLFGLDAVQKVELGGPVGNPLTINFAALSDTELEAIIQQLNGSKGST